MPVSTLIAAFRSLVTYLAIVLYIAVAAPLALIIGGGFKWKRGMYALGHAGAGLAMALAGIRYRIHGRENVPDTAVVFCSNHESNVDPAVLFNGLHPMLHILYKAELRSVPLMRLCSGRPARSREIDGLDRQRGRIAACGELVPHLSGGHAEPHR
jgi:hypothetical protein